jgi:hypothetical protein
MAAGTFCFLHLAEQFARLVIGPQPDITTFPLGLDVVRLSRVVPQCSGIGRLLRIGGVNLRPGPRTGRIR